MRLVLSYILPSINSDHFMEKLVNGYDILKYSRRAHRVKLTSNVLSMLIANREDTVILDNIYNYNINKNYIKIFVNIKTNYLNELVEYIWVKYILDVIENGVYVDNIYFLDYNFNMHGTFEEFTRALSIAKNGARGVILKGYSRLSNDLIVEFAQRLFRGGCDVVKEDETFFSSPDTLLERINKFIDFNNKIYVYNSLSLNPSNRPLRETDGLLASPLVPYLAVGYRRLWEWARIGYLVWGHRQGYQLLDKYVSRFVYLKLALLAGATFLHVGTPNSEEEFTRLENLIRELSDVKPFIPVFTGVPNHRVEDRLLDLSNNVAVLLSPIYWRECL